MLDDLHAQVIHNNISSARHKLVPARIATYVTAFVVSIFAGFGAVYIYKNLPPHFHQLMLDSIEAGFNGSTFVVVWMLLIAVIFYSIIGIGALVVIYAMQSWLDKKAAWAIPDSLQLPDKLRNYDAAAIEMIATKALGAESQFIEVRVTLVDGVPDRICLKVKEHALASTFVSTPLVFVTFSLFIGMAYGGFTILRNMF
jgi:hypothetical protein